MMWHGLKVEVLRLRGIPHGRQLAQTELCHWPRVAAPYHTTGTLLSGNLMWQGIHLPVNYQGKAPGSSYSPGQGAARAHPQLEPYSVVALLELEKAPDLLAFEGFWSDGAGRK
jgi:hypothetical protein